MSHAILSQELAPHVSVCVAPRVGVESHPVEDFRMIVPEQARHLGLQPLAHRAAASSTQGCSLDTEGCSL